MPDGNTTLQYKGKTIQIKSIVQDKPYMKACIESVKENFSKNDKKFSATIGQLKI